MLIQCTKKLLEEIGTKPVQGMDELPLFSWHANMIYINHRKTIVLANNSNQYVIVIYGLKTKDFNNIGDIIFEAIQETLFNEGIKAGIIRKYMNHSPQITFSKTKDRSLVARLNKACETAYIYEEEIDPKRLNQSVVSIKASGNPVGDGYGGYFHPYEQMYIDLEAFANEPIFSCKAVQLNVLLNLEKHNVTRRIIVPYNITFRQLHDVLQIAFGWKESHLHEFIIYDRDMPIINLVDNEEAFEYPGDAEMCMDKDVKLSDYIPGHSRIEYIYDFGDHWQHYILVKKIIEDYTQNYPVCLEWTGNAPPEDVGGEHGYEEFLEAYNDPNHEDHEDMVTWAGNWWYRDFYVDLANRRLKDILKSRY